MINSLATQNATRRYYMYIRYKELYNIDLYDKMMSESDYWLVMRDQPGLLVFDKMGNFFKSIKLDAKGGQLIHDDWLYCNDDKLMRLNLRNGENTEVELPFPVINSSIVLAPQRLIRLFDKTLEVYSY